MKLKLKLKLMERKGKDQGGKGNRIYLDNILRKKEKACTKKQRCLARYQEGRKLFESYS